MNFTSAEELLASPHFIGDRNVHSADMEAKFPMPETCDLYLAKSGGAYVRIRALQPGLYRGDILVLRRTYPEPFVGLGKLSNPILFDDFSPYSKPTPDHWVYFRPGEPLESLNWEDHPELVEKLQKEVESAAV